MVSLKCIIEKISIEYDHVRHKKSNGGAQLTLQALIDTILGN
jgi:hypothetical protein